MRISESPALRRYLRKPPRISLTAPFLHPPVATTSSWQLELATLLSWIRLAHQWPPNCVKVSLLVCMCIKLIACLVTFCSCTPMAFHPKSFTHQFLIVYELHLA
jgi:hypothetical protein